MENSIPYNGRCIWLPPEDPTVVHIIDQRHLPHQLVIEEIATSQQMCTAIADMHVRGAGTIDVAAAYGYYLACLEGQANNDFAGYVGAAAKRLLATRPTAVNLRWAIEEQQKAATNSPDRSPAALTAVALSTADGIFEKDIRWSRSIGQHGSKLIAAIAKEKPGQPVNVLTHCNAGWLAYIDRGTATAPIYAAHDAGLPVHVWVDETRPRNQGAALTAWELQQYGVPHTVIADNTGGHLMQHGMVDLVITGSDRTTRSGDVANKIGTYLKALAANDNGVPFYAALPASTIDWGITDGIAQIPIEQRSDAEVKYIQGLTASGEVQQVLLTPAKSPAANYAFDVTPARLVTGIITERGVVAANEAAIAAMFPDLASAHA